MINHEIERIEMMESIKRFPENVDRLSSRFRLIHDLYYSEFVQDFASKMDEKFPKKGFKKYISMMNIDKSNDKVFFKEDIISILKEIDLLSLDKNITRSILTNCLLKHFTNLFKVL